MPIPRNEPASAEAIAAWIAGRAQEHDRFRHVYDASERHRAAGHGPECTVYASGSGPVLGTLAAATDPKRILEVGCGLGYSALWLAFGSPEGRVETIECDPAHAELARGYFAREGFGERVTLLEGRAVDLLPALSGPYDLIFCDSDPDEYGTYPEHFLRLLKPGGLLITSNLFLGRYSLDIPGLDQAAAYREWLLAEERLLTAFLQGGMAISVLRER